MKQSRVSASSKVTAAVRAAHSHASTDRRFGMETGAAEVTAGTRSSSRLPTLHDMCKCAYMHTCTAGAMFNPVDKRAYLPLPCPHLPAGSVYIAVEYEVSC